MSVKVIYRTTARAVGGRDGFAETTDKSFHVDLGVPKEMGGNGKGNNPEQLFAAGYAACFIGAMKFVSSHGGPKIPDNAEVRVTVGIGPRDDEGFGLEVAIEASLPGLDRKEAETLLEKTEHVCPYAHATKGNVKTTMTLAS